MGKHKRKRDEIVEDLSERLRELENRLKKRSRYRHSDDYDSRSSRTHSSRTRNSRTPSRRLSSRDSVVTPTKDTHINVGEGADIQEIAAPIPEDVSLPSNIEELLGAEGMPLTTTAIELHDSLSQRWSAILQNGLNAETKANIIKKYDPPKNCHLLVPPKLNEEVAAALNESAVKRDQRIGGQQVVLAAAITTIGKALNTIIASQENKDQIETLSDSARLLCDLYHNNSMTRRSLILPGLNKDMKELMEQTPISEYLFGDKLQDKVNAIKAVKKSGLELKNTPAKLPAKPKNLNYRGPQRQQIPRPSGQKPRLKRNIHVTKATRTRRSPQRHHHPRRRGQDRR